MEKEFYFFQYHIYTVALNQYLRLRLPDYDYDEHFGGIFYIFIRGIEPKSGPEFGVYRDRPSKAFIQELSEAFIDGTCEEIA